MITSLAEFKAGWQQEAAGTRRLFEALTDDSLSRGVAQDHRTLGRLAWHLTQTIPEMTRKIGLGTEGPDEHAPVPTTVAEIVSAYTGASESLLRAIDQAGWTDHTLQMEDEMYGERWKRGFTLTALVLHQAHHRGQMTVLMRQAGLKVPGLYGPAMEDWAQWGVAPPAV